MRLNKKRRVIGLLAAAVLLMLLIRNKGLLITKAHPVMLQMEGRRITGRFADYQSLGTGWYSIHYQGNDDEAADMVKSIADTWGPEVLDFFCFHPSVPVNIMLYAEEDDLKGALRIPQGQSAIGAYAGGIVNLISPAAYKNSEAAIDSLTNVFVHELAHLALDKIAKGNYPLWFTEGSALYLEYILLGYEWGKGIKDEPAYSIEDLTYRFNSLDEQAAYRQSFLMVKQLIETHGREVYLDFLYSLGRGANFQEALTDRYGNDIFS
ncbi:MAG TPA: hypothetical protein GX505_02845 [Clostridiales bacterium]|nr:hypothetical protein [Clostridiales bacterium]